MSAERDVNRIVRSWIRADDHESADRVLEIVLSRLDTTPQRRHLRPSRRFTQMSNPFRLAIAAAAVLAVALIGYQFLPSNTGTTGGPGTPAPTLAPSATPTVTAPPPTAPPAPVGNLAPGRYAWTVPSGHMTFEVPAGWSGGRTTIFKHEDQPGELGIGVWHYDNFTVTHVYADTCLPPGTLVPVEATVDDLVNALEEQLSIDAVVADVTVAGQRAKRVDLTEPEGLDRSTCRHGADGPLQIWADAAENNYFSPATKMRGLAFILDMEAGPLVLFAAIDDAATPADLAELDAIFASLQLQ